MMTGRMKKAGAMLAAAFLPLAFACSDDPAGPVGGSVALERPGLTIEPGEVQIQLGQSYQLKAIMRNDDGTPLDREEANEIHWSSSNPDVVDVEAGGLVEALGLGTAMITADCGNECAYAKVTVVPKGTIDPPGKEEDELKN